MKIAVVVNGGGGVGFNGCWLVGGCTILLDNFVAHFITNCTRAFRLKPDKRERREGKKEEIKNEYHNQRCRCQHFWKKRPTIFNNDHLHTYPLFSFHFASMKASFAEWKLSGNEQAAIKWPEGDQFLQHAPTQVSNSLPRTSYPTLQHTMRKIAVFACPPLCKTLCRTIKKTAKWFIQLGNGKESWIKGWHRPGRICFIRAEQDSSTRQQYTQPQKHNTVPYFLHLFWQQHMRDCMRVVVPAVSKNGALRPEQPHQHTSIHIHKQTQTPRTRQGQLTSRKKKKKVVKEPLSFRRQHSFRLSINLAAIDAVQTIQKLPPEMVCINARCTVSFCPMRRFRENSLTSPTYSIVGVGE